jgi:hypothetical protein
MVSVRGVGGSFGTGHSVSRGGWRYSNPPTLPTLPVRAAAIRFCRIERASGKADLATGGRDVRSHHRRTSGPAATCGPVTPRRVGGEHRATSIDGITLSDQGRSGRRSPSRLTCSAVSVCREAVVAAPDRVICERHSRHRHGRAIPDHAVERVNKASARHGGRTDWLPPLQPTTDVPTWSALIFAYTQDRFRWARR